jgi:hypothetical protein
MKLLSQNRHILSFLFFICTFSFTEECTTLNPNNYGNCEDILGYVWNGQECTIVYGCNANEDASYFFEFYESCDVTCNPEPALGDVNSDNIINVVDIVSLVTLVLSGENYIQSADINFDLIINVIDIVALVSFILNTNESRDTWQIINQDILSSKCAICHYEGSSYAQNSDLILEENIAYEQLLNRIPNNVSANNNGLSLINNQGGLYGLLTSYFWEKINIQNELHFYSDHPQYGQIMPLGGPYLTNGELNFIEQWIWEGSPETGTVADPIILNDTSIYEAPEFVALDPPINGIQYHIESFEVLPNTERELLYYVPPINGEVFINRVEISMAPGSHHFIAYSFSDNYSPPFGDNSPPNQYEYRDIHAPYAENWDLLYNLYDLNEHTFIFGTQWPFWDYSMPEGVALKFESDFGFDLNPHYFNYTNESIHGEVYFNIHTLLPSEVDHQAGILQLGKSDISLPPNQETTLTKVFSASQLVDNMNIDQPEGSTNLNIFQLFSHAHQLMTRFDILILQPNGDEELIYTALDYEHPPILELDPPLVIQPNQGLISRATYYNNTNNIVEFGLYSTNEMMIVFGLAYFD